RSPTRPASVRLPARGPVPPSRTLFASRTAPASKPRTVADHHASAVTVPTITYVVPHVATSPKKTKTINSPRPRPAYGRGPPLYRSAAKIASAPTARITPGEVANARARPASPANRNATSAAAATAVGDA